MAHPLFLDSLSLTSIRVTNRLSSFGVTSFIPIFVLALSMNSFMQVSCRFIVSTFLESSASFASSSRCSVSYLCICSAQFRILVCFSFCVLFSHSIILLFIVLFIFLMRLSMFIFINPFINFRDMALIIKWVRASARPASVRRTAECDAGISYFRRLYCSVSLFSPHADAATLARRCATIAFNAAGGIYKPDFCVGGKNGRFCACVYRHPVIGEKEKWEQYSFCKVNFISPFTVPFLSFRLA